MEITSRLKKDERERDGVETKEKRGMDESSHFLFGLFTNLSLIHRLSPCYAFTALISSESTLIDKDVLRGFDCRFNTYSMW